MFYTFGKNKTSLALRFQGPHHARKTFQMRNPNRIRFALKRKMVLTMTRQLTRLACIVIIIITSIYEYVIYVN